MSNLRQVGLGILTALFSTGLVFGSMLLALTEGGIHVALAPAQTVAPLIATPKPGEPTFTVTPSLIPTEMPTETASVCPNRPAGWIEHEVETGEMLPQLAQFYGIPIEMLRNANCLIVDTLVGGSVLFVPPSTPTPTPTPTPTSTLPPPTETKVKKEPTRPVVVCNGPPKSWILYIVKRGDTLFSIARTYRTTAAILKAENCLTSNNIRTGQRIKVPNNPPLTPKSTATRVPPRPTSKPPVKPPPIKPPVEPPPPGPVATEPPPYP